MLVERHEPDQYFTAEQHARMRTLIDRQETLSGVERAELEDLINAELDATISRTELQDPRTIA